MRYWRQHNAAVAEKMDGYMLRRRLSVWSDKGTFHLCYHSTCMPFDCHMHCTSGQYHARELSLTNVVTEIDQ